MPNNLHSLYIMLKWRVVTLLCVTNSHSNSDITVNYNLSPLVRWDIEIFRLLNENFEKKWVFVERMQQWVLWGQKHLSVMPQDGWALLMWNKGPTVIPNTDKRTKRKSSNIVSFLWRYLEFCGFSFFSCLYKTFSELEKNSRHTEGF